MIVLLLSSSALAKPPAPMPTTCPWSGPPIVGDVGPNEVTIGGVPYKVGGKNLAAFAGLLNVCNASSTLNAFGSWQQAQSAVAIAVAQGAASSISWAGRIAGAKTADEKKQLVAQAATEAASIAANVAALNMAAKSQRDAFQLALVTTSATGATASVP